MATGRGRASLISTALGVGRGERVTTSADPFVTPNNVSRNTNVGGVATFVYHRDSDTGAIEMITARSGDLEATARQIWAAPIPPAPER
ncbi:MAG: hypothetical protein OXQ26_04535 [bacterium]|nr:hypothetical protein [bacterium]